MIDVGKYYKLLDDLNENISDKTWKLYKKYHIDLIDDYQLCLKLMKRPSYEKEINKLRKKFGMHENGIMDSSLLNKINLQYKEHVYNSKGKDDEGV